MLNLQQIDKEDEILKIGKTALRLFIALFIGVSIFISGAVWADEITAQEAMKPGIVDEVVSSNKLEEAALDAAQHFTQKPARSLAGVKRLINYSMKDLKVYMELEYEELIRIVKTRDYQGSNLDVS